MNLIDHLREQADLRPDAVALIDHSGRRKRTLTFAQLEAHSASGARLMRSAGIGVGGRVLFAHPVSLELYTGLLSALRAGATPVFADVSSGRKHLDSACGALRPDAFFGSGRAQLLRLTSPAIRRIPVRFSTGKLFGAHPWTTAGNHRFPPVSVPADHPALISFTSGSTGAPKVIARSHGFLLAQNRSLRSALRLESGGIDLVTLPIFALANLSAGVTSALADCDLRFPGSPDPRAIQTQLVDDHIRRATASPAFFETLLSAGVDLSALTQIYTGGAPVFPRLLSDLQMAAPEAAIAAVYGSSEAEPIAHLDSRAITPEDERSMRSGGGILAGTPVPDIRIRILLSPWHPRGRELTDQEFEDLTLPTGRAGEIVVSGGHVLPGYLNGIGDERTKIKVGETVWHRTGDGGKLDARGRLWLLGRCSAAIRDQRGILYSLAAEGALSYLPDLRRSAIVSHRGRRAAVIESSAPIDLHRVRSEIPWADIELAFNAPIPVDRRHNAKIDYPRLHSLLDSAARRRGILRRPALRFLTSGKSGG